MREKHPLALRFRGFIPFVVDVECGGFDPKKDALLEVAIQAIEMDENHILLPGELRSHHIIPFKGAHLDPKCLEFTKIDPYHPFRFAKEEAEALADLANFIRVNVKKYQGERGVLVGHNAWFDLAFMKQAFFRSKIENPFHNFTSLDTATLSALAFGQTVLPKALASARIPYDNNEAHSAIYDTECTAKLFCLIFNQWKQLGGWPLQEMASPQEGCD